MTVPEKEQIATKRKYNTSYKCSFTLPAVNDKGEYPLSIELLKVNGQENKDASAKLEKTIAVASKVAAKIPVVEEYTGGWYGNCVRGIGSLNYMAENFEDFIGIAYHNNDAMEVLAQREFPESVGGFPYARFDRTYDTDIYYGQRRDSQYGLDAHWIELAQQSAPAEISVKAEWNGEDKSSIKVTSSVNFVEDDDFNLYTLAYVLLHDNMSGKGARWKQKNYYVGDSRFKFDPYMEQFVNGEEEMYPIYNEVMVACSDIRGIANSLPREVKADTPVEHEFIFNVNDVKNTAGQGLIQDKNKLRVAVLMIGSNRKIANAGKAFVPGYDGEALKAVGKGNPTVPRVEVSSSVQDLESEDAGAKIVAYYDMTGREIRNPENGVYIVRLSNGNTRKCVIRK